jgi:hypothetical protein
MLSAISIVLFIAATCLLTSQLRLHIILRRYKKQIDTMNASYKIDKAVLEQFEQQFLLLSTQTWSKQTWLTIQRNVLAELLLDSNLRGQLQAWYYDPKNKEAVKVRIYIAPDELTISSQDKETYSARL